MPLDRSRIDEMKAIFTLAKNRKIGFGLCLGKKPENTVMLFDKIKAPEQLMRQAKQDGETPLATCGTIGVDGQKLNLFCDGDAPPGLQRKMREFLHVVGLKYKPIIHDADGNVLEGEGAAGGADGAADGAGADPLVKEWQEVKLRLGAEVKACVEMAGGAEILADWQACVAVADGGDLRGALMAAEAVERKIAEARDAAANADADRDRWTAVMAKLEPMVKEFENAASSAAKKVQAVWAFAKGKAAAAPPDFAAAIKSIAPLVKLIQAARAADGQSPETEVPEQAVTDQDVGASAGQETSERAGGLSQRAAGKTAPGATGGASAAPGGDAGTATLDPGAPGGAVPGAPPAPGGPGAAAVPAAPGGPAAAGPTAPAGPKVPPGKDASEQEKLDYADEQLKALDPLIADYLAVIPGSAETTPAAWTDAKAKIDAILAPMRGPGGKIDAKKLADAQKAIDKLAAAMTAAKATKTEWKKSLDLINARLVPLDRHAQAAAAQIAPKIAAIKAEIAKAVAAADTGDFKKAEALVKPLAETCDKLEKLADDVAHYNSILAQRQGAVAGIGALTGDKEIDKVKKAIDKLMADATALAGKEKFAEAIKKLDQIPPLADSHQRLSAQQTEYTNNYNGATAWIANTKVARTAKVRAMLKPQLDTLEKDVKAAEYSKTKSYGKSCALLGAIGGRIFGASSYLDRELDAATDYDTAKTAFDPQYEMFKKHKGVSGIQDFFDAMDRDRTQAESEFKSGKFGTAAALLKRSAPDWAAQKVLADKCEFYLTKRKDVEKLIAGLKKLPAALDMLAQAETLLASAFKQFTAKDFDAAKATVDEAEKRANDAKAAAEAQKGLDKKGDDKALKGIAKDFDKAVKVYDDMRAEVAGKDAAGTFAAELAKADVEVKKARDEKAKPKPDYKAARKSIDDGIALLKATLPKVMASVPFATHLAAAKVLAATMTDPDNKLTPQVTRANQAVTDAENLVKSPGFDFKSAEDKLVAAREGALKAVADAALWPQIKADRAAVETAETNITAVGDPVKTMMKATSDRLALWKKKIDDAITAEDFKAATRLAADAKKAAGLTANDLASAQAVNTSLANNYTARLPLVSGPNKNKAKSQLDLLAKKKAQFDAAMKVGNYEAALNLIVEMGWAIDAAVRILGEHTAYEADRAAAEAELATLKTNRNAGVEDEVKAAEKRYADGVALSDAETNLPAQKIMVALKADCTKLIAKAAAWKAYDDARKAAETKIAALDGHAQAAAVKPMADALRGKVEGAKATADKGDLAGAKTALDKIPAEADAALATADKAKAVTDKADALGGGAIDPALLAEAKKLYDDLAARADADVAKAELNVAKGQLDGAASAADPAKAKTQLKAAMQACTLAQSKLSQQQMVNDALTEVQAQLTALKGHAQSAYISKETKEIEDEIAAIKADTAKSGPKAAGDRVSKLNERCAAVKVLADTEDKYLTRRAEPEVEPRLPQLEQHPDRFAVKPSIDAFRKKLDDAAAKNAAKESRGGAEGSRRGRDHRQRRLGDGRDEGQQAALGGRGEEDTRRPRRLGGARRDDRPARTRRPARRGPRRLRGPLRRQAGSLCRPRCRRRAQRADRRRPAEGPEHQALLPDHVEAAEGPCGRQRLDAQVPLDRRQAAGQLLQRRQEGSGDARGRRRAEFGLWLRPRSRGRRRRQGLPAGQQGRGQVLLVEHAPRGRPCGGRQARLHEQERQGRRLWRLDRIQHRHPDDRQGGGGAFQIRRGLYRPVPVGQRHAGGAADPDRGEMQRRGMGETPGRGRGLDQDRVDRQRALDGERHRHQDRHRRHGLSGELRFPLDQLRARRPQAGHDRLSVPRPRRMVRRALCRLSFGQAEAVASRGRLALGALTRAEGIDQCHCFTPST